MSASPPNSPVKLNGWKEIATFFGKSPRTVQRWEAELGLPVRRLKGQTGDIVYAVVEELEAWRDGRSRTPDADDAADEDESPVTVPEPVGPEPTNSTGGRAGWVQVHLSVAIGVVAVALVLVAITALWRRLSPIPIVTAEFSGSAVVAKDAAGHSIWRFEPGHELARQNLTRAPRSLRLEGSPRVVDLDGDGRREVLAVVGRAVPGLLIPQQTLVCLSDTGKIRWHFSPDIRRSFGGKPFGPPWLMTDVAITYRGTRATVWLSIVHSLWWPSFVFRIDDVGRASVALVNAGAVYALEPVNHGGVSNSPVLAVGVNNEWTAAMTVVLMPDSLPVVSPGADHGEFRCTDCSGRTTPRYMLLPRSEMNLADPFLPYNFAVDLFRTDNRLSVTTTESEVHNIQAIYNLAADATTVESYEVTDGTGKVHALLESEGRLNHAWADCPDRRGREIRYWNGAGGWSVSQVPLR